MKHFFKYVVLFACISIIAMVWNKCHAQAPYHGPIDNTVKFPINHNGLNFTVSGDVLKDSIGGGGKNIGNSDLRVASPARFLYGNSGQNAFVIDSFSQVLIGDIYTGNNLFVTDMSVGKSIGMASRSIDDKAKCFLELDAPSGGGTGLTLRIDSLADDGSTEKTASFGVGSASGYRFVFSDSWGNGIQYAENYHSTFKPLSLVDKGYVDSVNLHSPNIENSDLTVTDAVRYLHGDNNENAFVVDSFGQIVFGDVLKSYVAISKDASQDNMIFRQSSDLDTNFTAWIKTNGADSGRVSLAFGMDSVSGGNPVKSANISVNSESKTLIVKNDWGNGIEYAKDYNATLVPLSLVSKGYVDSAILNITIQDTAFAASKSSISLNIDTSIKLASVELGGKGSKIWVQNTYNSDSTINAGGIYLTAANDVGLNSGNKAAINLDNIGSSDVRIGVLDNAFTSLSNPAKGLVINSSSMYVYDNTSNLGLRYASDYKANFVGNSLITKLYADSAIATLKSEIVHDGTPAVTTVMPGIVVTIEPLSNDKFGIIHIENTTGAAIDSAQIKLAYATEFPAYAVAVVTASQYIPNAYWMPDVATEGSLQNQVFYLSVESLPANTTYTFNYIVNGN